MPALGDTTVRNSALVALEGLQRHAEQVPRRASSEGTSMKRLALAGPHLRARGGSLPEGQVGAQLVEEALRGQQVLLAQVEDLHVPRAELLHPVRVHPQGRVALDGLHRVQVDVVADVEVQLGDLPTSSASCSLKAVTSSSTPSRFSSSPRTHHSASNTPTVGWLPVGVSNATR